MTGLGLFGTFPLSVRLLLVNQLVGNIGFFMLVPFLADYLRTDLALSAAVVGVVLGVRNLSQQGLFLVGGSASDRLGARGVIIVGAGIRAAGFALFAVGGSLPVVLLASVLTGFAGALFNPAVRAYIARDSDDRAAEAFALFNVFGNTGSAVGPVVGMLLVGAGFRLTAVAAAAVFAGLTIAQLILLPARPAPRRDTALRADFARVFADHRFWAFALALMGMFALQSQIYFLFTLQVQDLAGPSAGSAAVAVLFVVETIAVVALQVPTTRMLSRRTDRGSAMALGMAVLGAAFLVPPAAAAILSPGGDGFVAIAARVAPVVVAAVVLAFGVMAVQPFVNEAIPRFSGPHLTGTYFGAFYLASGVFTVASTSLVGTAVDHAGGPLTWPPALLCAGTGFLSAVAVLVLRGRGYLPEATTAQPRPITATTSRTAKGESAR
ncbi:MFS transporter [Nocardia amikacinitolerans]|uniref:MFS transporter n=1 Tax=Nocardia amikacinitolerans TaxID=756689 RepID=UPI0020A547F4|nr:MFS transporter [Nocardia amikacinitolerans]MCP2288800.1 Major Facilitator Superfamily protein [Nocardia amikacinitolerans]